MKESPLDVYDRVIGVGMELRGQRPVPRPVVYIDITGGVEQWRITAPGNGEPEVYVVDNDDEASIDDLDTVLATQLLAYRSLEGRIPPEVYDNLRVGIDATRDRIQTLELEGFTRYDQ